MEQHKFVKEELTKTYLEEGLDYQDVINPYDMDDHLYFLNEYKKSVANLRAAHSRVRLSIKGLINN